MINLDSPCIDHGGKANYKRDWHYGYTHRRVYIEAYGDIPEGHEIDHVCQNKRCINAEHLEAVTHRENVLRGKSTGANAQRTNRCKRGHEFTPENTIVKKDGRRCRTCFNQKDKEYKRRKRLTNASA